MEDGPAPTRSTLEDDVLEVIRHGGEPQINAVVFGEEVDLFYPDAGVVLEIQGSPHDNPTAHADDAAKAARLRARGLKVYSLS